MISLLTRWRLRQSVGAVHGRHPGIPASRLRLVRARTCPPEGCSYLLAEILRNWYPDKGFASEATRTSLPV
jgi:hypothetical protein